MLGGCRCRGVNSHTLRNPASTSYRIVLSSTRLTVALLIMGMGCAGILLTQRALFALIGGKFDASWGPALCGASLIGGAFLLARYRNDLVDD